MFNIGEFVLYSSHGICRIDDISEKSYLGVSRHYYDLHPIANCNLKISAPVDNDKTTISRLVDKEEAQKIVESFMLPGIGWINVNTERTQTYTQIVKKGNRIEISKIVSTLMVEKRKADSEGRKFHERDIKLLDTVKNNLFTELAMSLNMTYEEIDTKINEMINGRIKLQL